MLVRPQHKHGPKAEMNVVPYIDVMLVLLVIFMVTAPLLVQGVKLELPKVAAKALPTDSQKTILSLSVVADGSYYWNVGSEVDIKSRSDQAVTLDEMVIKIDQIRLQHPVDLCCLFLSFDTLLGLFVVLHHTGTGSLTDFFGFVATLDKVLGSKNTQLGLRFKVHSV